MTAPLLVLGWGNPSRGDDALGPMLVDALVAYAGRALPAGTVDCLSDYQLQIEHALDLVGRERVLFVDAARGLVIWRSRCGSTLRTRQAASSPRAASTKSTRSRPTRSSACSICSW